jgi:AcrR family transcriptional regulator
LPSWRLFQTVIYLWHGFCIWQIKGRTFIITDQAWVGVRHVSNRKSEILEAAERILSRFGPRRTTIEDIADEIGLSRPAIYQYFPNKKAVLKAVAERIHQKSLQRVSAELDRKGDLTDQIVQALNARDGHFFDEILSTARLTWYLDPNDADIIPILESSQRVYEVLLRRHLTKNQFPSDRVETTAKLLIALSAGLRMTVRDRARFEELLYASVEQLVSTQKEGITA